MYNFLTWLEKERGECVASATIITSFFVGIAVITLLIIWLIHITNGWIILAVLIAPAWVAWMFYCYITRERDQ